MKKQQPIVLTKEVPINGKKYKKGSSPKVSKEIRTALLESGEAKLKTGATDGSKGI